MTGVSLKSQCKTSLSLALRPKEVETLSPSDCSQLKRNSKKDKIRSKPDKNGKRGEAGKSQKQLQWIEEEKLNKTQKEGPKTQINAKYIQALKE
nr:hypothetical protein [Tanacetum cinerariifolium]